MEVLYRKLFLKDLERLKGPEAFEKIKKVVFEDLPQAENLNDIINLKPLENTNDRFRIRVGDYRIGIKVYGLTVEVMRVKHKKEFYRFYP